MLGLEAGHGRSEQQLGTHHFSGNMPAESCWVFGAMLLDADATSEIITQQVGANFACRIAKCPSVLSTEAAAHIAVQRNPRTFDKETLMAAVRIEFAVCHIIMPIKVIPPYGQALVRARGFLQLYHSYM